jgi:hypothetical protein
VPLDHHVAEVQHGDPLREVQRHVHVVLDHHDRDASGYACHQLQDVAALLDGEPGEGLVQQ